ncbi:DNA-directed DNA polymerase II small subunit [Candidatus Woesearchaeota archaeon]|nr:DNA-directed DNA polymerase II small subunit [Candidatus Woesearchaeota archaeon]
MDTRTYIKTCIAQGMLPSVEAAQSLTDFSQFVIPQEAVVLSPEAISIVTSGKNIDWLQLDRLRVHSERGKSSGYEQYLEYVNIHQQPQKPQDIVITSTYEGGAAKHTVDDFVQHFTQRFTMLERMLRVRPELENSISISRTINKQSRENVSIIAMVVEKRESKNGNLMFTVEDRTGNIKILVSKSKPELFQEARDIVPDEVIGIEGVCGNNIIFVNNLFWPDVPYNHELKKVNDDVYAVFLSDMHVGSTYFLAEEFNRFLKWINGTSGTEAQREIAQKVKYIFIAGDVVDGVGIYPGQEKELSIPDIYQQYDECARLIKQIPSHLPILLCPGNHDALRLSEPQPPLDKEFARALYNIPNVTIVSNPSMITIHANDPSGGIDVMMYHGYSFDYYVAQVDTIRNRGGYQRADLIMKYLLKRRHLSPAFGSTLRIPDAKHDPLTISKLPDILVTGHIHYSIAANYRNITMLSGSCWQSTTDFQRKMGHKPEPARAPVINLRTREVKILKFI